VILQLRGVPDHPGSSADNPSEYDYWDHVDYLIDLAW